VAPTATYIPKLALPPFGFGQSQSLSHNYSLCGQYEVATSCRNAYGETSDSGQFLSREFQTFEAYMNKGYELNVSVAGVDAFLKVTLTLKTMKT
jgi:hypothetical protein